MLESIIAQKREEIHELRISLNMNEVIPRVNKFNPQAVFTSENKRVGVIAELKKASPIKGVLRPVFNLPDMASAYVENGATALSVITDNRFFQGHPSFLREVRPEVQLPILRKDFIIDKLQLYETLLLGADLVLLIAALHNYTELLQLIQKCGELGIEPLLEIHDREELKKALDLPIQIIGVNNRNLQNFMVDIRTSLELAEYIPDSLIRVSESGIKTVADMQLLEDHGFQAALIGEALVSSLNSGLKLRELVNYDQG